MSDETKASATVSDYLRWRGDLTFAQDGFNEVDNLLLCIISYIKLENIPQLRSFDPQDAMPMGDVCRLLTEEDEQLGLSTLDYIPLMRQAAETPRFREVSLFAFESLHDEDRQMQFAAVSFLLPDGSVYAAYRGTDMTIVGWQEDFNMSFLSAVPAQVKAAEYAGAVARACPGRALRIGGHSKGGNLAAWAAVHLDETLQRQRLIAAYNNDGPGFSRDLVDTPAIRRWRIGCSPISPPPPSWGSCWSTPRTMRWWTAPPGPLCSTSPCPGAWKAPGSSTWASGPSWASCPTECCGSGSAP